MKRFVTLSRVVVTGRGGITPLGLDAKALWHGLVSGRSGISAIKHFDARDFPIKIAGYIHDFDPQNYMTHKQARRTARFTQLALVAAKEAISDAGLDLDAEDLTRIGVEIGCATGSIETIVGQQEIMRKKGPRRLVPSTIIGGLINMATCQVAMEFGLKGPGGAPVAACATGLYAIGDAYRRLQRGEADVMIAGASESFLDKLAIAAFWRIQALSTSNDCPKRASRPFDKERNGTVMSEGSAILVLETEEHALARGAKILGEIVGYGQSLDAFHIIAPDASGVGAARAMQQALNEAEVEPEEVDWISAHATATPLNDLAETLAIKRVFGETAYDIPVSGLKSMTGHMLGAAGAVSILANLQAIQDGIIPPTINYHTPDPELDLDYVPNKARKKKVNVALSNAFGIGGQNASIVVRRYQPAQV